MNTLKGVNIEGVWAEEPSRGDKSFLFLFFWKMFKEDRGSFNMNFEEVELKSL